MTVFVARAALAQAPPTDDAPPKQSAPAKKAKRVKKAAAPAPAPLPCARAKYKDDPVCFGADDPAALPLPTAQSGGGNVSARHSEDVSITPKARVNQATPEPVYLNNPSPKPSASDFGGGVGLDFHF